MGLIVDLVIGLALIFFLFSMLVSALQELLASWLNWRGQMLQESLLRMLDGTVPPRRGTIWARLWGLFLQKYWDKRRVDLPPESLAGAVLDHGLVVALARGERLPAYLPSGIVADALVDIFRRMAGETAPTGDGIRWAIDHLPPRAPVTAFRTILVAAAGDVVRFRSGLVDWYEAQMERVSGWYTRETRYFLMLLGALAAVAFNVDAVSLTNAIREQPALRQQLVDKAKQEAAQKPDAQVPPDFNSSYAALARLSLPIGWPAANICAAEPSAAAASGILCPAGMNVAPNKIPLALVGWLLTAIAVSLGAPFWFDLMTTFVNLRNAGTPPAPSSANGTSNPATDKTPNWTPPSTAPSASPVDPPVDTFEASLLSPDEIRLLQQRIGASPTSEVDAQTRARIRDFQRGHGLPVDGRISPELLHALAL